MIRFACLLSEVPNLEILPVSKPRGAREKHADIELSLNSYALEALTSDLAVPK